jgi:hypothetical protein
MAARKAAMRVTTGGKAQDQVRITKTFPNGKPANVRKCSKEIE